MTILYILLFIVCLSTLIMVHEAGHLLTAKAFKVYCFEYAIGFGPRLFSFKRKNGETRFSIRAIPFGGFVSMYGESETVPEDVGPIDPSRSLNNVKKWKKSLIMTAGIMMNFILAIVVFFIYEIAFPGHIARLAHVTIKKDSIAYNAGLRSEDYVYSPMLLNDYYIFYDDNAILEYPDSSLNDVYFGYDYASMTLKNQSLVSHAVAFDKVNYSYIQIPSEPVTYEEVLTGDYSAAEVVTNFITGFLRASSIKKSGDHYLAKIAITENYLDKADKAVYAEITIPNDKELVKQFKKIPAGSTVALAGDIVYKNKRNEFVVEDLKGLEAYYADTSENLLKHKINGVLPDKISFSLFVLDEATNIGKGEQKNLGILRLNSGKFEDKNIGISMQMDTYRNSFGTSVKNSFVDFGQSATLIYRGLGSLFTKDGWKNVGGIIAIGVSSTQILQEYGFGTFLYYWAMISVNLGIVNLLPFPGLDGWHFLVTIIEGVTRKEIPSKLKNIMSAIGLVLLFSLMVLVIVKDLFMVI